MAKKTAFKKTEKASPKAELLVLTPDEQREFKRCHKTVRDGMNTFLEVGEALMTIRQKNLYRVTHKTFEAFCRSEFEMGKSHAYRLIDSAQVVHDLAPLKETGFPMPANERQARVLIDLPTEKRLETWGRIVSEAKSQEKKITARLIDAVVTSDKPTSKNATKKVASSRFNKANVKKFITDLEGLLTSGKATEAQKLIEGFKAAL